LIPAILLIPLIVGALRLWGQELGFYDSRMGAALAVVFDVGVLLLILYWTALAIDRADRRRHQMEQAILKSNTELQHFAYVASHDLQEPLRLVASYTQLLERRYKGRLDSKADQYIHYAVDGARRMQLLIQDLLRYSRLETRAGAFRPTPLERVLSETLGVLQPTIDETQALVTHDPLPTVAVEETQMGQLLQNLIGNAIKFRREGVTPRVHISSKLQGAEWVFAVHDNGIGIEKEYWARIFEIFQRLHPHSEYPGSGIGLAICKKIVERHHGRMWLESMPGAGSTFYFTLLKEDARHGENGSGSSD
jgi:light-regulated signal transduction histidine kinase (bacteriophytochrome)